MGTPRKSQESIISDSRKSSRNENKILSQESKESEDMILLTDMDERRDRMTRPRVGHAMSRVIETPRSVAKTVVYYGETTNKPSSPRVDRPAGDATTTDRRSRHGRMRIELWQSFS